MTLVKRKDSSTTRSRNPQVGNHHCRFCQVDNECILRDIVSFAFEADSQCNPA